MSIRLPFLLLLAALSSLLDPILGQVLTSDNRTIVLVSDVQLTGPTLPDLYGKQVRPAHSWIFVAGSRLDPPMRIELVSPEYSGQPRRREFAISVIVNDSSTSHMSPEELFPTPPHTDRRAISLETAEYVSNGDIFRPLMFWTHSLIDTIWVDNTKAIDASLAAKPIQDSDEFFQNSDEFFQNSHDFAWKLLASRLLTNIEASRDSGDLVQGVLREGEYWVWAAKEAFDLKRLSPRPVRVEHVFFEGPPSNENPTGRAVFGLDAGPDIPTASGTYRDYFPRLQARQWDGVLLGRDPVVTSGIPLECVNPTRIALVAAGGDGFTCIVQAD